MLRLYRQVADQGHLAAPLRSNAPTSIYPLSLVIAGTAVTAATILGYVSIRCFLGPVHAEVLLRGRDPMKWPRGTWIFLPSMTVQLVLKPLVFTPVAAVTTLVGLTVPGGHKFLPYRYTPTILAITLPIVHDLCRTASHRLFLRLARAHVTSSVRQAGDDAPEGSETVQDVDVEMFVNNLRDALERREPLTLRGLDRAIMGSVILPPVAALLGELLRRISGHSRVMRTFLGMETGLPLGTSRTASRWLHGTMIQGCRF